MPSTIFGPPAVEQQDELDFELQRGLTRRRIVRGRRTDVENYLISTQLNQFPYSISSHEGGLCTATVTLGAGESQDPTDPDYNPNVPISIEWSFSSNQYEKKLVEHPKIIEKLAALPSSDLAIFNKWVNDMEAGKATSDPDFFIDVDIRTVAYKLARGEDAFIVPSATLVQNMRFTPATTYWPILASIGTVYTNAQLASVFGVPTDVQAVLPQGKWIGVRIDYNRDSAGYRNTTQEWQYGKVIDPWTYPHYPTTPLGTAVAEQMNGIIEKFDDWLSARLPGLTPPAR